MTQLFIQLVQSVAGAVIFIVALLIVAAVIGYVSAWFYAGSVYKPVIKKLEEEKADLIVQVANLKKETEKLNASIEVLQAKIKSLESDLAKKEKEIQDQKKKVNG